MADQSNAALSASPVTPANQLSNTSNKISGAAQTTNTTSSNEEPSFNTSSLSSANTSSDVTASTCTTSRCLANMLIEKEALSQPQSPKCITIIRVPLIAYETLSVDTKNQRFKSILRVTISWEDPDLSWDTSVYPHDTVVLPVRKVWTPNLQVTNGVQTKTTPGNQDLLVHSNGTVEHSVIMNTLVECEVNLYSYPFISDNCDIAINAWELNGCGMLLKFESVNITSGKIGDWITEGASIVAQQGRDDRYYLQVSLKMRSDNQFQSLILPSILITMADVVSYALPLGSRICFKIKLILSFVMFINLLSNLLPAGGQCSPIIQRHFSFCLVVLVFTTLQSMVVTRLAKCGTILPSGLFKSKGLNSKDTDDGQHGEPESDISVIEIKVSKEDKKKPLQKVSWEDLDLSWDTSVYPHDTVVLPVRKIWTPNLHVTNGVETTTRPGNQDLLVHSNGTVEHSVIMNTVVGCEVNLYNYPFVSDFCVIAINVWTLNDCGIFLVFGDVIKSSSHSGDWLTEAVELTAQGGRDDRNYLGVSLKMRSENPFLSLVLPSILIILADVVSYALPLDDGKRIPFKITLVLSFIMFLNILNNLLPGGGQCSPIIRKHFSFCLVVLVLSMLQSMVVTRLAKSGTVLPCSLSKSRDSNLQGEDKGEDRNEGTHFLLQ
ncbi:hypothetical protein DPEC_G00308290 [Dallia pectoralis]|uniref:Uncharacterized protein n=1 Tax=Dallia pectoralis TaxID=75939 RepID=A0ACC2FEL2_DALPE|nr:hypothetical protein DPEC_G00308290 [Dallia pectoralis]